MSKNTEILNLEELLPEEPRIIQIKGVEYLVPEASLEQDLQTRRLINKLRDVESQPGFEASAQENEELFFETMQQIIRIRVPDMPESVLDGMSMPRLTAVFRFVQGASLEDLKAEIDRVNSEVSKAMAKTEKQEGGEKN